MQLPRALLLAVGLLEAVLECHALSVGLSESDAQTRPTPVPLPDIGTFSGHHGPPTTPVPIPVPTPSPTPATPGDYDEIPDHFCPGGQIQRFDGLSLNQCKLQCDADTTCVAFVRSRTTGPTFGRCWMKDATHCDKTVIMQPHATRDVYWKDGELDGSVNAALAGLPTPAPPTPAPPTPATPVNQAAVGDPHLVNIHGQRFDIYQPGAHTLVQVPKGSGPEGTLLRVDALAAKLGGACGDLYFTALNMTGLWANEGRGLRFFAGREPKPSGSWQVFGQVSMKVKAGRTAGGIDYLNVYARDLSKVGFPVGGLLGDDDHTAASRVTANCRTKVSLLQDDESA